MMSTIHEYRKTIFAEESTLQTTRIDLAALQARILAEVTAMPHLAAIRDYNHTNLEAAAQQFKGPLKEARMLDVGGSIHGFALDSADRLGFGEYIGIDLDVTRHWGTPLLAVKNEDRRHLLLQMDAHRLWLENDSVDVVVCLSGFEHYLFPELVVSEILRVMRKGGVALINYEPIWTCSYGHHLHHFGLGFEQVPPWSHLILTKTQMGALLETKNWPANCAITRAHALEWIYDGREINRRNVRFHEQLLRQITCSEMLWLLPHTDPSVEAQSSASFVASMLPYSRTELLTRGFSCCFRK